jgi:hypothetical protein
MKEKQNDESIRFMIPKELKDKFFKKCYKSFRKPSDVLRYMIKEYLNKPF